MSLILTLLSYWIGISCRKTIHDGVTMQINEARLIRHIKRGCTFRKLAEIYYEKNDPRSGNQLCGVELCQDALTALGIENGGLVTIGVDIPQYKSKQFDKENLSYGSNYYWWE